MADKPVMQLEQISSKRWQRSQTIASVRSNGAVPLEKLGSYTAGRTAGSQQPAAPAESGAATHSPCSGPQEMVEKDCHRGALSLQSRPMHQELVRRIEKMGGKNRDVAIKAARNLLGLASHRQPRLVPELLEAPAMVVAPWLGQAPTFPDISVSKSSYERDQPGMDQPASAGACTALTDTCEALSSPSIQEDDVPRTMSVNISAEVDPYVAACEGGALLVKLPFMTVSVSTSIHPPLLDTDVDLPPMLQLNVPLPAMSELLFDPVRKEPKNGRCEVSSSQHFGLMEISADIGASLRTRSQPLRGLLQLQTGQNEMTAVNFKGEVLGRFSMVPGKRAVSLDLEYKVVCALSGAGSAAFTSDGQSLEPIVSMT